MKILQITFSLAPGGAERFVVDLSNELSKNNDVTLLTLKDDKVDVEVRNFYKFDISERVNYMNLGLGDGFHPLYLIQIYKVIKDFNPDVVHFHGCNMIKYVYYACLRLGNKIPFVQTIHSDLYYGYTTNFYKLAYHTLALHGKLRWVALSTTNFNQLKKEYPDAKSRCIFNGRAPMTPTAKFDDVKKGISALKDNADTKVILHVARCSPPKNQKLLISSFNTLREQGRNAILLIIGAHFDTDEGKQLVAMAGEGIHFLGTRTNIADYMLNSDFFVLSSSYEGMPITLLEAMLSGTPMVSTPVTGAVDVINGKNGILSKDLTEASYVAALNKMLDNLDQYKAEAMKEKDNSPYTIKHCAEQYIDFYKE